MKSWIAADGTYYEECKLMIFLGNTLLGELEWNPGEHPETRWHRRGWAFFCGECGEVWGRLLMLDHIGQLVLTEPVEISCEKHTDRWNTPGSMLGVIESAVPFLPTLALKREFEVNLAEAERAILSDR